MTQRQVVITGANRGLGLELARQCVARGDAVWATCRTPDAADELRALSPAAVLPLDVMDADAIERCATDLAQRTERVDLLINNAGANATAFGGTREGSGVFDLDGEHFMAQMRLNALGPMLLTRALLPLLRASQRAVVANISSQLGALALGKRMRRDIGYNASKAALNMITRATAGALQDEAIDTVTIHPGWVRTDMGGPHADVLAEDSAQGVLQVIEDLAPEDSGSFYTWDGRPHPW